MLIKFLIFTIFLTAADGNAHANEPDPFVEKLQNKKFLKMPNGKEVILVRLFNEIGPNNHMRFFLREKGKVLWDVTYNDDFRTLWADAHFIPLYGQEFISDLNSDGTFEIAVAIWHGGNAMKHCRAVVFTFKEDSLVPLNTHEINYEFSRSVYKDKEEAKLKIDGDSIK